MDILSQGERAVTDNNEKETDERAEKIVVAVERKKKGKRKQYDVKIIADNSTLIAPSIMLYLLFFFSMRYMYVCVCVYTCIYIYVYVYIRCIFVMPVERHVNVSSI